MADPPEIEELAKRYFDLWQDHLSGMAADPEWAAATTRIFAAFVSPEMGAENVPSGFDAYKAWLGGMIGDADQGDQTERPAAPAGPSADRSDDLRELKRQLTALQERLARLEDTGSGA